MIFALECLESYELKNINLKNQDSNTKKSVLQFCNASQAR